MDHYSGGSWTMIPTHNTNPTQSNQDSLYLHQQQQQQQFLHHQTQQTFQQSPQQSPFQQQQQTFQQSPQQSQFQQQQQTFQQSPQRSQFQQQQHLYQQRLIHQQQQPQPQPQPQPQQNLHQSLASHFHLLHLVENLGEVIEHGTRDQQSEALINELSSHFEKCQQLLNSISGSISTKAMTVEGQKKKLEESEQLLTQRRDLIANYRKSVEDLVKSEP